MKKMLLTCMCCLTTLACSPKQEPGPAPEVPPASAAPQAEKPGAPVTIVSATDMEIPLGQEQSTELELAVETGKGHMSINITTDDGLQILESATEKHIDLPTDQPIKIPLRLLAVKPGRFYLHVQASIDEGDTVSARHLAVIVQTSSTSSQAQAQAPVPKTKQKQGGEKVISLPAKEIISKP